MIKKFENFNTNEVTDTVKDICLELEDQGYNVLHSSVDDLFENNNSVNIRRIKDDHFVSFSPNDIKEVIDRLKEYLCSNWIVLRFSYDLYSYTGSIDWGKKVASVKIQYRT